MRFTRFSLDNMTDGGEILYGLVVCEKGEAKGHGLFIDDGFLDSIVDLAKTGPVKLRINHPGAQGNVLSIIAKGTNFRRSITSKGVECVRCDGHMIDVADESTKKLVTLAHKAPDLFGMSVDCITKITRELKNGLKTVIATTLNAVDFVDIPAATSSLFSQPVDSPNNDSNKEHLMAETTAELEARLKAESDRQKLESDRARQSEEEKKGKEKERESKMEAALAWISTKMEAEEKEKREKMEEEEKKKMAAAGNAGNVSMSQKQMDEMVVRLSAEVLAKAGVALKAATPAPKPGDNETPAEPTLTADEQKLALTVGLSKDDFKQFAANLQHTKQVQSLRL